MTDPNSGATMQPGGIYYLPPQARKNSAPVIDQAGLTDAAVADDLTEEEESKPKARRKRPKEPTPE